MYLFFVTISMLIFYASNLAAIDLELESQLQYRIVELSEKAQTLRCEKGRSAPELMFFYGKLEAYYEILFFMYDDLRYCHDTGPSCPAVSIDVRSSCSRAAVCSQEKTTLGCRHGPARASSPTHDLGPPHQLSPRTA